MIGPHNLDILSIIICGMLGKKFFSTLNIETFIPIKDEKKKRLKKFERNQIILPNDLKEILIGLLLGDLCAQKRSSKGNTNLHFEQGIKHKDYIFHLFDLFKNFCRSNPKISDRLADKRTGKIYTRVQFATLTLPCFNELYTLFYPLNRKIVPLNITELLTPVGLVYWICDDGTYNKKHKYIRLATNSYTLQEVHLLLEVLRNKFNLKCYAIQEKTGYVITISAKSVLNLQSLLNPLMPIMMQHKIGM